MTTVTIYSDNSISANSIITGYSVSQESTGTVVRKNHNNGYAHPKDFGDIMAMPQSRYALSSESGLDTFKRDFAQIWESK